MEIFNNIWNNISGLKSLSSLLQWISIVLIFFGGFLQITKQIIDRREKTLSEKVQLEKEGQKKIQEEQLKEKVGNLEGDLDTKLKEINDLKEKAKYTNPFEQPIHSGSSKIVVTIESKEDINYHFMDSGAYIAFGKRSEALMTMNSMDSFGISNGNNTVTYTANLNLDANDVSIGKTVRSLKETEFVQIGFTKMPENSKVIGGNVVCTINGIVRFEIKITSQKMLKDFILTRSLADTFKEFK